MNSYLSAGSDLPEQLRLRLQALERRTAWEYALLAALVATLVGLLASIFFFRQPLRVDIALPAAVVFGALLLILLVAWLAEERGKQARIADTRLMAETLQRFLATEQAMRDPLTGAYNRAALQELSDRYISRARRTGQGLALLVMDLDNFHELNNEYGHAAGDTALSDFVAILHKSTRGSDVVARYGGDEFVVLMPETNVAGAAVVVKRIQQRLSERNEAGEAGTAPLAFTAGASEFEKTMGFHDLFAEADQVMLKHKANRGAVGSRQ